ncbi:unnamed protein product [Allacma fusca]|uniref:Uncharacterized protein n=1 Tax=Allacma fusca TaxID=39272 RepID=A0A8J2P7K3_9HEXA|nr:unnamed protein product [Allacma fusca]
MYSVNILFGILTFKSLRKITKASRQADKYSTKQKEDMGIFFLKLFLLMGVSITLNFILSFLEGEAVRWLHIMVVFVTSLRGMAIAWMLLSDPRIKRQLLEKSYRITVCISQTANKYQFKSRSSFKGTPETLNARASGV